MKELQLPFQSLNVEELRRKNSYLNHIPVDSYENVRPRLLIGVQHASITLVRKSREGNVGQPIAIKTHLGWTIYGGPPDNQPMSMVHYTCHVCACSYQDENSLDLAVKEYFAINSLGIAKQTNELTQ